MKTTKTHKASDLAQLLKGRLVGKDSLVQRLSDKPSAGTVLVLAEAKHSDQFEDKELAALVVNKEVTSQHSLIIVKDTRLALAQLSYLFSEQARVATGIHKTAVIHKSAHLADDVHIAEYVVIKANVVIGAGTQIGAGVMIAENTNIGEHCTLYPKVSLYAGTRLGKRVVLHAGAIIGSDGFGYAMSEQGAAKIYHLGSVVLEDDVEIGANTCIDRATLGETRIGARSKIDNLCQIGHNTVIGSDCLIAGTVAIAGSTTLGRGVMLGGGVGVINHAHIHDGATVGARALVTKDIPAGQTWTGHPAEPYKKYVRKHYLLNQLESIWQAVKPLVKPKDTN